MLELKLLSIHSIKKQELDKGWKNAAIFTAAKVNSASVGPNLPTTILWKPVKCFLYSILGWGNYSYKITPKCMLQECRKGLWVWDAY